MIDHTKKWYVLYTKPNFEKKVYKQLIEKHIETFLPLQSKMKQWSDRKKILEEPLFRSYIFIHTRENERVLSLGTIGVVRCVTFQGRFAVVRDIEIENIKRLINFGKPIEVLPSIMIGTKVKIIRGPLLGIEGILTEIKGGKWFTIDIEALTTSLSVEVPVTDLEKMS